MNEFITLETVLKELHEISGFRISIHDIEVNEIASYPKSLSKFCMLIQQHSGMRKSCMANDSIAFDYVKKINNLIFIGVDLVFMKQWPLFIIQIYCRDT